MKKACLAFLSLFAATLCADVFENVEFQLPEHACNWNITRSETEGPTGMTKVALYMSEGTPLEMFMIVASPEISESYATLDLEAAKNKIQELMPDLDAEIELLESHDSSHLFKMHMNLEAPVTLSLTSWIRTVYSDTGTLVILYQTADEANLNDAWLECVKTAKFIR